MARRFATPEDFELVDMSSDPTPGDPDEIQGVVQRYQDIGDAAQKALDVLKKDGAIASGRGSAVDQLRDKIGDDLPDKLRKTGQSYHDAADAYKAYMPRLQEAQETFDKAVEQARNAAPQANQTAPALAADATDQQIADATKAQQGIDAAKTDMSAAKSLAEQAQSMRESAEKTCADALDRAAAEAIPERNIFQKIADFFEDFPFVQILLGLLIGVVSVFFPVVGALLGASLFIISEVGAIGSGRFKLGDLLTGLIGLIPGGSVLKGITLGLKGGAAVVSKLLPGLAKTVSGTIKSIGTTITASKSIGPLLKSPLLNGRAAKIAGAGIGGFADKTVDETTTEAINGEGLDPAQIAENAATGVITGGVEKGKDVFGKGGAAAQAAPAGIPNKTSGSGTGSSGEGGETAPASTSGGTAGAASSAGSETPPASTSGSTAAASSAGNAAAPASASGDTAGNTAAPASTSGDTAASSTAEASSGDSTGSDNTTGSASSSGDAKPAPTGIPVKNGGILSKPVSPTVDAGSGAVDAGGDGDDDNNDQAGIGVLSNSADGNGSPTTNDPLAEPRTPTTNFTDPLAEPARP